MVQQFYTMTMPGLETVAFSEIRSHVPDAELSKFMRGIALFRTNVAPEELLTLRTTEDVFLALTHIKGLQHGADALRVLHATTLKIDIHNTLMQWRRTHRGAHAKTWRVVSQMVGNYQFRRVDAGNSVTSALRRAMPRNMRLVEDEADVEIWVWLGGGDVLIGLRLSDASMRHRTYKHEHLPASLRPTVAASMAWLSQPRAQDIVLDPLCGAGTLLVERALLGPVARSLGGDVREDAVKMARRNARTAKVDMNLQEWDACDLPLDAASVTHIITNLPFGKQIGTHAENKVLYKALMKEFDRVVAVGGRIVSLTSEDQLWEQIVHNQGWRIVKKVILIVLGQPASIYITERA
jgi:tRNA (guanine6-N2)-methyltransferase